MREPIKSIEQRLPPRRFARVHRSAIVNLSRVRELHPLFGGEYQVALSTGARLTEVDVAEQLRASRTPAREALHRLVQDGLLVASGVGNGGKTRLMVARMSPAEVTELYHAAGALEGIAARAVADMSAADRRGLAVRLREAERAFREEGRRRSPDWDRMFTLHDAFHRTFVDALAGPRLRGLLETLRPQLDRYEYLYAPLLGPDYDATFAEHEAIIHAMAGGTAAAAERAVRDNWFGGARRLARAVRERGEASFLSGLAAEPRRVDPRRE